MSTEERRRVYIIAEKNKKSIRAPLMLSVNHCNSVFRVILYVVRSGSIRPCSKVVSPFNRVFYHFHQAY